MNYAPTSAKYGWINANDPEYVTAADVIAILVGTAPVDMMPAMNTEGRAEVVLPVPMYPKFGRAVTAAVEDASAPRPTLVTADIDPEAENAERLVCATAVIMLAKAEVPTFLKTLALVGTALNTAICVTVSAAPKVCVELV
jgi:hypothetical protein